MGLRHKAVGTSIVEETCRMANNMIRKSRDAVNTAGTVATDAVGAAASGVSKVATSTGIAAMNAFYDTRDQIANVVAANSSVLDAARSVAGATDALTELVSDPGGVFYNAVTGASSPALPVLTSPPRDSNRKRKFDSTLSPQPRLLSKTPKKPDSCKRPKREKINRSSQDLEHFTQCIQSQYSIWSASKEAEEGCIKRVSDIDDQLYQLQKEKKGALAKQNYSRMQKGKALSDARAIADEFGVGMYSVLGCSSVANYLELNYVSQLKDKTAGELRAIMRGLYQKGLHENVRNNERLRKGEGLFRDDYEVPDVNDGLPEDVAYWRLYQVAEMDDYGKPTTEEYRRVITRNNNVLALQMAYRIAHYLDLEIDMEPDDTEWKKGWLLAVKQRRDGLLMGADLPSSSSAAAGGGGGGDLQLYQNM